MRRKGMLERDAEQGQLVFFWKVCMIDIRALVKRVLQFDLRLVH